MRALEIHNTLRLISRAFSAPRVLATIRRSLDTYAAYRMRQAHRALQWRGLSVTGLQPSSTLSPKPKQATR